MKAAEILGDHNLKRTSCREDIIKAIMGSDVALSTDEIRKRMAGDYDRTTLYRSFKTLESSHILHKIVVDGQTVKYALGDTGPENPGHVHFYCNKCHTVICLEDVPNLKYDLPDGFSYNETDVLIKGICPRCREKGEDDAEN
ncbi:MAG: transcriptional repressor [Bacteroidales bacterium]|nr:transcriptional repressor [Bacteroidales bacterium]MCI2121501.1 transcriptional repressor [Bacteroidales bacterium]MCI2145134.1 transcriptional repressor [Bacteroidales bacterium]